MRIAICSNLTNGIGLEREYRLLCEFLQSLAHNVFGVQYDAPLHDYAERADLMISLETVARHLLPIAPMHWWFPNPEWCTSDLLPVVDRHFQKIFTKTREAQRIFEPLFPERVFYVGFLVRDQFDATIFRKRQFLHVGGNGSLRNTQAVLDAWKWKHKGKGIDAQLTVVSRIAGLNLSDFPPDVPPVKFFKEVSEEELKRLQNSCLYHLQPSATEGFGHSLRESVTCGAILLTTDAAPMNEVDAQYRVPSVGTGKFNMATTHEVSAISIHAAVQDMLASEPTDYKPDAPNPVLEQNEYFRNSFAQHVAAVDPSKPIPKWKRRLEGVKSIAFLGNFRHTFSTESDLAWSFEFDGHEVIRMQENEIGLRGLEQALHADMFLWVRTPDWLRVPDDEMYRFLERLHSAGVPSVGYHLDKFFQIPERETLIGKIPFWKCEHVFTADGAHANEFTKRGVRHHWMLPGVVLRGCYPGVPQPDLRVDVGFVGTVEGYHDIYPERVELIRFLEGAFGNRFRVFSGYREGRLNDLYASVKVCIGDSIFANQGKSPKYVSDRATETQGRGGVLVHPRVEGVNFPGWITHEPGNFDDLARKVEELLLHGDVRRAVRDIGMWDVARNHNYCKRIETILETVFQ